MATDLSTTRKRLDVAEEVRGRRAEGQTWGEITKDHGFSETTGRKLLKELEEYEAKKDKGSVVLPGLGSVPRPPADADEKKATPKPANDQPKARSGRYLKLSCGCGHVIRTGKAVAESASIHCTTCDKPFTEAE